MNIFTVGCHRLKQVRPGSRATSTLPSLSYGSEDFGSSDLRNFIKRKSKEYCGFLVEEPEEDGGEVIEEEVGLITELVVLNAGLKERC